jgi:subtilisin family serine protease
LLALLICALALTASAWPSGQSSPLSPWLQTTLRQSRDGQRHLVWIYLRTGTPDAYVAQIRPVVARVRHLSRWFNAVSAEATAAQIEALGTLPFVARIDVVGRYRKPAIEPIEPTDARVERARGALRTQATTLDYGSSYEQLAQIGVPALHERGLSGEGVVVAVFDSGFPNLAHEALAGARILGERDFVQGGDSVRGSTDAHGLATLSVLGGYREGELIGPAYGASFVLAVTEDVRSETPIEEDNWVAAAEWAEAMGADVISSSLGYLEFDFPHTSYTPQDMNGDTAVTTRAAAMAAARGIVVVTSAGNGGAHAERNTLGAPADGRFVLSVGAVDRDGLRAPFSSVGPTSDGRVKPDVAALGVRAKVASRAGVGAYALASGTSFSCPLAAGVVALLLEAHPSYTVDQVFFALRSTASQAALPDNLLGWGLVDAARAVDADVGAASILLRLPHVLRPSR